MEEKEEDYMTVEIDLKSKLDSQWTLYYHDVNNDDFSRDTFRKVCKYSTIGEMLFMINKLTTFQSGMFFIMRDDTSPLFKDPENINGGMWTYKIPKKDSDNIFKNLVVATSMEVLTKDPSQMPQINGLSVSPKINNLVIKIWSNNPTEKDPERLFTHIEGLDHNTARFKLNKSF